jgi:hypothetical protein
VGGFCVSAVGDLGRPVIYREAGEKK